MAYAVNSGVERAFLRAKELLRKESTLTDPECDELAELFDEVSGSQFLALTQDPKHARALRKYDRYTRRPGRKIIAAMTVLFVFSVLMGIYVSWQQ